MSLLFYIKTTWINKIPGVQAGTKVNATNMNKIEQGIYDVTEAVVNYKAEGTGTITTTGWVANTGDYPLKLNLAVTGILTTDSVDVFINNDDQDVAQDAELSPNNDSYAGGITFYAKNTPAATIGFAFRRLR